MVDNIEKVLERGEKIELLVDKTDNLRFQASAWADTVASWGSSYQLEVMTSVDHLHRMSFPLYRTLAGRQIPQDRQAAAQQDVVAEHADEDHHRHRGPGPHPGHLPPSAPPLILAPPLHTRLRMSCSAHMLCLAPCASALSTLANDVLCRAQACFAPANHCIH